MSSMNPVAPAPPRPPVMPQPPRPPTAVARPPGPPLPPQAPSMPQPPAQPQPPSSSAHGSGHAAPSQPHGQSKHHQSSKHQQSTTTSSSSHHQGRATGGSAAAPSGLVPVLTPNLSALPQTMQAIARDFQHSKRFLNQLPTIPNGPYFTDINQSPTFASFEKFSQYHVSTLEKKYVWEPHLGPYVGVTVDLVDSESMFSLDNTTYTNADLKVSASDQRFLRHNPNEKDLSGRKILSTLTQDNKPWWLRDTSYLENNLYNTSKLTQKGSTEIYTRAKVEKLKTFGDLKDLSEASYINETFDLVERKYQELVEAAKSGIEATAQATAASPRVSAAVAAAAAAGQVAVAAVAAPEIEYSVPILPFDISQIQMDFERKIFTAARFDENPVDLIAQIHQTHGTAVVAAGGGGETDGVGAASRDPNLQHPSTIITNIRTTVDKNHIVNKETIFEVSLVASTRPTAAAAAARVASSQPTKRKRNSEEDKDEDRATTDTTNGNESEEQTGILYDWVRDYHMDIQSNNVKDVFYFVVDPPTVETAAAAAAGALASPTSSRSGRIGRGQTRACKYLAVQSRVDMKKLNFDDSVPYQACVTRR